MVILFGTNMPLHTADLRPGFSMTLSAPPGHWHWRRGKRRGALPPALPQRPVPHKQLRGHQHVGPAGPRGQGSVPAGGGGLGRGVGPAAHQAAAPRHRHRRGWQQPGLLAVGLRGDARREQPRRHSHPPAQREWALTFELRLLTLAQKSIFRSRTIPLQHVKYVHMSKHVCHEMWGSCIIPFALIPCSLMRSFEC